MWKKFLAAVFCACALVLLPAPPQAEAGIISREEEIKMGRATAQQLEAKYGLYQNWQQHERINRIGQSLAAVCGRNDLEFSFKILNANEVNALACPGGFVYVFKGLLDYMPSDTELAGVLGHEIGHVAKKHTVHAIEKQLLTTLLLIAAARGQGANLIAAAQQALFAGYSRTDERGADKEGFYNTVNAGYNPYAMLITACKLEDLAQAGGGASYGLFSSHPEPEERIKRQEKLLKKLNIHPDVVLIDDDHALVAEGDWRFPINRSIGSTKAKYRAYLLAGSLWTVRQRGAVDPNRFVVYDNGSYAHLYYDDIQLLTVYTQDAAGLSAGAYAADCTASLRQWAELANSPNPKKKK